MTSEFFAVVLTALSHRVESVDLVLDEMVDEVTSGRIRDNAVAEKYADEIKADGFETIVNYLVRSGTSYEAILSRIEKNAWKPQRKSA